MNSFEIRAMGQALLKQAEGEHVQNPVRHGASAVAAGTGGLLSGMALGFGTAHAANALYQRAQGRPIPVGSLIPAAALLATAGATAYNTYKMQELEEMQRAFRSWQQQHKPGT